MVTIRVNSIIVDDAYITGMLYSKGDSIGGWTIENKKSMRKKKLEELFPDFKK